MIKNILNLGDAALYCDFGNEINKDTNSKVIKYFKSIKKKNIDGINNLTPSYNKLIVSFLDLSLQEKAYPLQILSYSKSNFY